MQSLQDATLHKTLDSSNQAEEWQPVSESLLHLSTSQTVNLLPFGIVVGVSVRAGYQIYFFLCREEKTFPNPAIKPFSIYVSHICAIGL